MDRDLNKFIHDRVAQEFRTTINRKLKPLKGYGDTVKPGDWVKVRFVDEAKKSKTYTPIKEWIDGPMQILDYDKVAMWALDPRRGRGPTSFHYQGAYLKGVPQTHFRREFIKVPAPKRKAAKR